MQKKTIYLLCTLLSTSLNTMETKDHEQLSLAIEAEKNARDFNKLPSELYVYLMQFLDDAEIENTSATCKFLRVFF